MQSEPLRTWTGEIKADHHARKVFTETEKKAAMNILGQAVAHFIAQGCPPALVAASLSALSGIVMRDKHACQCDECWTKHKELTDFLYQNVAFTDKARASGLILPGGTR